MSPRYQRVSKVPIHSFLLGSSSCDYLVLRDFEGLPKEVGFDLDVLVDKVILDKISDMLTKTALDLVRLYQFAQRDKA